VDPGRATGAKKHDPVQHRIMPYTDKLALLRRFLPDLNYPQKVAFQWWTQSMRPKPG